MKISIVLLTGFLGSGKTTLLNQILASKKQVDGVIDLAVVVNEFGTVGVDGELLSGEEVKQVELPGGCVCCQLDEDLEKTLQTMISDYPDLKQIIIETTGIAEPLPISWTLAKNSLAKSVHLTAVLTVVDALEILENLKTSPSTENQIEFSDLLYVAKSSLASDEQLGKLRPLLKGMNNHAPLVFDNDEHGFAELQVMLSDVDVQKAHRVFTSNQDTQKSMEDRHSFDSQSLMIDDVLDLEELTEALEALPSHYIRIKGVAMIFDGESSQKKAIPMAFHRVGARVSFDKANQTTQGKIVAIGKSILLEPLIKCIERSKSRVK